jgi:uncharacterized protein YuzE
MRVTYDETADAAYIYLLEDGEVARTDTIDEGTFVDVDAAGTLIGIEILTPARSWALDAIAQRYPMNLADVLAIRALWPDGGPFPFAPQQQAVATAIAVQAGAGPEIAPTG